MRLYRHRDTGRYWLADEHAALEVGDAIDDVLRRTAGDLRTRAELTGLLVPVDAGVHNQVIGTAGNVRQYGNVGGDVHFNE